MNPDPHPACCLLSLVMYRDSPPSTPLLVAGMVFALLVMYQDKRDLAEAILPKKAIQRLSQGRAYLQDFNCTTLLFAEYVVCRVQRLGPLSVCRVGGL